MSQEKSNAPESDAIASKVIRVASIIDSHTIVLNAGSDDGIRASTSFLIYGQGEEVIDPETQESLGILEVVRGRGKVIHLQEKLCTVESITTKTVPGAKKTIRRERSGLNKGIFGHMSPIEEIEEGARTVDVPFDNVLIGDFARKL